MDFKTTSGTDGTTIHFSGEIDMQYSPAVRAEILAQLDGGNSLHINLQQVTYMDSSGIACLIEGLQKSKAQQLEFTLVAPQSQVMQMLKLARLDQVFTIIDVATQSEP